MLEQNKCIPTILVHNTKHRKKKRSCWGLYLAQGALEKPDTKISELCKELGITRQTLYRHLSPTGQFREDALKLLAKKKD